MFCVNGHTFESRFMRKKKHTRYKIIEHTADLGVIVYGRDLKELFSNSALTLVDLMVSAPSTAEGNEIPLTISGQDLPDLMVRWLGEILYLFSGESLLVVGVEISEISSGSINGVLTAVPLEDTRYETVHEIKAVTYHQIRVDQVEGLWEARVFFDL